MSGKISLAQFKQSFGANATIVGGHLSPEQILIVGLDVPLQDDPDQDGYNGDLWDEARLAHAQARPIDPQRLLLTLDMGGDVPPVEVVRHKMGILCVDGRRRVLSGRAANKLLLEKGVPVEQLVELPVIPAKGSDLAVTARLANEGRLEDPPWIKAQNAARLRARGKSDLQIAAIFNVQLQTIVMWSQYMNLHSSIRGEVENDNLAKDARVPFVIGCEIGKLGKEEVTRQQFALAYLRSQGARLTGEQGRENAKSVVRAILRGEMESLPNAAGVLEAATASVLAQEQSAPVVQALQEEPPVDISPTPPPSSASPVSEKGPRSKNPRIITSHTIIPRHVREVFARLEPTEKEPLSEEADRAVFATLAVIVGQDPTGEGLKDWPFIYQAFQPYLRTERLEDTK